MDVKSRRLHNEIHQILRIPCPRGSLWQSDCHTSCLFAGSCQVRNTILYVVLNAHELLESSTQKNPADLGTICGDDASKVQQVIASVCGSNADAAQAAFSSTCAGAGSTICSFALSASSDVMLTVPSSSILYRLCHLLCPRQ